MKHPCPDLLDALENTTEALANTVLHLGHMMTEGDRYGRTKVVETARALIAQARAKPKRRLAVKVEREKNALASLPELAVKILDYVRDNGRVTTRDMVRETGASPNTLKATFTSLVEKGLLVRYGVGRSTWYALP